jgi:hypothetical protein
MKNERKKYIFIMSFFSLLLFVVYNFPNQQTHISKEKNTIIGHNEYLINPGIRICGKDKGKNLLIVSFNPSGVSYFHRRQVVRNTWANESYKQHKHTKNIFLVGRSLNESINQQLNKESETYGDILQVDFVDSYDRLIDKTIFGIRWMAEYCENAKLILKVDDDMVVNTRVLLEYFSKLGKENPSALSNRIYGRCKHPYMTPIRDIKDKHYISREDYAPDLWPNYCLGPAYIIASDLLGPLYNLTKYIKHIPMEDVYVGILAKQLKIELVDVKDWMLEYWHPPVWHDSSYKELTKITDRFFLFINIAEFEYFYLNWKIIFSQYLMDK